MDGAIAGGQIGYNWQSNNWVFGIEADAQWSDEKGRACSTAPQRASADRAFPA
ncbi:outer membrane protein [Bradyrhizobium sp. RDT10]